MTDARQTVAGRLAGQGGPRTALISSAQHWTAPVHLSAHHLAKLLVGRGWLVAFVSTPTSLLHRVRFARDPVTIARFDNWRQGGARDLDGRLYHYTPLAVVPPSRLPILDSAMLLRSWPRLTWPNVANRLAGEGFGRIDLAVLDSALMLPVWRALGRPRLVYRITDRNSDLPDQPAALAAMEREIVQAAELVVCTGDRLLPYAGALAARATLSVPNGVELAHFAAGGACPADLASIPEPRAIYVGSLGAWFDHHLVVRLAAAMPEISLVIVGPGGERRPSSSALPPNLHFLGARPYAAIPAYLSASRVGLIPFRRQGMAAFVDDINPLKLYEYMAAGLPVVSTPMAQVAALASPAIVAGDEAAMIAAIRDACLRPRDSAPEQAFAARFDWSRQFQPLVERLGL